MTAEAEPKQSHDECTCLLLLTDKGWTQVGVCFQHSPEQTFEQVNEQLHPPMSGSEDK